MPDEPGSDPATRAEMDHEVSEVRRELAEILEYMNDRLVAIERKLGLLPQKKSANKRP